MCHVEGLAALQGNTDEPPSDAYSDEEFSAAKEVGHDEADDSSGSNEDNGHLQAEMAPYVGSTLLLPPLRASVNWPKAGRHMW